MFPLNTSIYIWGNSQLVMFDDQRILRKSAFWWMPGSPQQQSLSWSGLGSGLQGIFSMDSLFPTCQVRVVRFYVSCLLLLSSPLLLISSPPPPRRPPRPPRPTATRDPQCSLSDLNHDHPCSVFPAGPQPRVSMPSVPCRTSTMTIHAQCSLPDLNHDHPRPVFPAGPQPRPSTPSVPCRTSTTTIHAQCYLPDLNREYPRQVFPTGPHVGRYGTKNVQKKVRKNVHRWTSTAR